MNRAYIAAIAMAATLAAAPAFAATMNYTASLSGKTEVPATTSAGTGEMLGSLDTVTKTLSYTVTYNGLSGAATAAHIHGPADVGKNAGVMLPFAAPANPISGKATLTDDQMKALESGMTYVNVHTAANPGGEIRGQVVKGKN